MNRELIMVIDQLGREKGIDKEILFEALESALLSASRKSLGPGDNVRIHIDRKTGEFRVYHRKKVVEEVTDPEIEMTLAEAQALAPEAELGVELELLQDKPLQDLGRTVLRDDEGAHGRTISARARAASSTSPTRRRSG